MDTSGTYPPTLSTMAGLALACLLCACTPAPKDPDQLGRRMAGIAQPAPGSQVPCASLAVQHPLVLLVLGQSNAGNHGSASRYPTPVPVITAEGTCHNSLDPLPGGTGEGASVWTRLPAALRAEGFTRPVVLAVLAVDASSSAEWARPDSPLPARLETLAAATRAQGLPPALVLWHQGEADARSGTAPEVYTQALRTVAARLKAAGVGAPWLLAQSTRCRSPASEPLRQAVRTLASAEPGFLLGPDTDTLGAEDYRSDGCHFNDAGLDAAARLWARALTPLAERS